MANRRMSMRVAVENTTAHSSPVNDGAVKEEYESLRLMVRGGFFIGLIVIAGLELFLPGRMYAWADSDISRDDTGPNPVLESPDKQLFPKIKIADAVGWQNGAMPKASGEFLVNEFAGRLDHPRW